MNETKFDDEMIDWIQDLKLWGYDLKELRSMRDFALSHGWKKDKVGRVDD